MEITVNKNLQSYYLAMRNIEGKTKWCKVIGHIVAVGEYQFGVTSLPNGESGSEINVTEISTGSRVKTFQNNLIIEAMTATKAGTLTFIETVVAEYLKTIVKLPEFATEVTKSKKINESEFGPMPDSETYDESFIVEPISEYLN